MMKRQRQRRTARKDLKTKREEEEVWLRHYQDGNRSNGTESCALGAAEVLRSRGFRVVSGFLLYRAYWLFWLGAMIRVPEFRGLGV